jgi:hypothetical protein
LGLFPLAALGYTTFGFTVESDLTEEGVLKAIFFSHASSVRLLLHYPFILFLDLTYKINQFKMCLLHIAGLGGNDQNLSIAFCFTSEQSHPSYSWALQTLLSLFTSH